MDKEDVKFTPAEILSFYLGISILQLRVRTEQLKTPTFLDNREFEIITVKNCLGHP